MHGYDPNNRAQTPGTETEIEPAKQRTKRKRRAKRRQKRRKRGRRSKGDPAERKEDESVGLQRSRNIARTKTRKAAKDSRNRQREEDRAKHVEQVVAARIDEFFGALCTDDTADPLHDDVWRDVCERFQGVVSAEEIVSGDVVSADDASEEHDDPDEQSSEDEVDTEGSDDDSDDEGEVLCYSPSHPPQQPHTLRCHNPFASLPDCQEDGREVITISDSPGEELSEDSQPSDGEPEEVDVGTCEPEDVDSDGDVESVFDGVCEEQPAEETVTAGSTSRGRVHRGQSTTHKSTSARSTRFHFDTESLTRRRPPLRKRGPSGRFKRLKTHKVADGQDAGRNSRKSIAKRLYDTVTEAKVDTTPAYTVLVSRDGTKYKMINNRLIDDQQPGMDAYVTVDLIGDEGSLQEFKVRERRWMNVPRQFQQLPGTVLFSIPLERQTVRKQVQLTWTKKDVRSILRTPLDPCSVTTTHEIHTSTNTVRAREKEAIVRRLVDSSGLSPHEINCNAEVEARDTEHRRSRRRRADKGVTYTVTWNETVAVCTESWDSDDDGRHVRWTEELLKGDSDDEENFAATADEQPVHPVPSATSEILKSVNGYEVRRYDILDRCKDGQRAEYGRWLTIMVKLMIAKLCHLV